MADVVVVGAGLAGLSAAYRLVSNGRRTLVLEAADVVGGRTASWEDDGMPVESGLHRVLGFYRELPALMTACGIDVDAVVSWEDEVEIRGADGARAVLGAAPLRKPLATLFGPLVNRGLLSARDLASLTPFFAAGFAAYAVAPHWLDRMTVLDFARRLRVTERAVEHLVVPTTAGIFFLPPGRYSAFNYFGLFAPALPRAAQARVGAFRGGMTEVMCQPIADAIVQAGGEVRTATPVLAVERADGPVVGVHRARGSSGRPTSSWPPSSVPPSDCCGRSSVTTRGSSRCSRCPPPQRRRSSSSSTPPRWTSTAPRSGPVRHWPASPSSRARPSARCRDGCR